MLLSIVVTIALGFSSVPKEPDAKPFVSEFTQRPTDGSYDLKTAGYTAHDDQGGARSPVHPQPAAAPGRPARKDGCLLALDYRVPRRKPNEPGCWKPKWSGAAAAGCVVATHASEAGPA